mmetsp:Transcript_24902/g.28789  ORF Transcript_24902/g.28789 Transcript_24902/m.28789 type:complete len:384 (+) Transcript_24902:51-1202(+)
MTDNRDDLDLPPLPNTGRVKKDHRDDDNDDNDDYHEEKKMVPLQPLKAIRQSSAPKKDEAIRKEMAMKIEVMKKLSEREIRLAEFKANKEREIAKLREEREIHTRIKMESIQRIKKEKEKRRLKTLRKISEKERRANDVLRQRERLAHEGRSHAVEIRDKLTRVLERSLRKKSAQSEDLNSQKNSSISSHHHSQGIMQQFLSFEGKTLIPHLHEAKESVDEQILMTLNSCSTLHENESEDMSEFLNGDGNKTNVVNNYEIKRIDKTVSKIVEDNIIMKSTTNRMTEVFDSILAELSLLNSKVKELEDLLDDKDIEIDILEENISKIDAWKTKSILIILSLTLIINGAGLYAYIYKDPNRSTGQDMTKCMKALPSFVIQCFKST